MPYVFTRVNANAAKKTRTITRGVAGQSGYSSVVEEQIVDILSAENDINQELLTINRQIRDLQARKAELEAEKKVFEF